MVAFLISPSLSLSIYWKIYTWFKYGAIYWIELLIYGASLTKPSSNRLRKLRRGLIQIKWKIFSQQWSVSAQASSEQLSSPSYIHDCAFLRGKGIHVLFSHCHQLAHETTWHEINMIVELPLSQEIKFVGVCGPKYAINTKKWMITKNSLTKENFSHVNGVGPSHFLVFATFCFLIM